MRGHKTFLFISIITIVISKNILVLARGPLLLVPYHPARPSSIQKKKEAALADYQHHCQHQHEDQYDHDDPQHDHGDLKEDAQHRSTNSIVGGGINKKVLGGVLVVPSPTKEEETVMLTKNNNNVLQMNNDDRQKNHLIILLQEEEGSISNHAVASAVQLRGGGRRLRQLHKKQTRRFAFNAIISYIILQKVMSSYGPINFIQHSNAIVHVLWILFHTFSIDIVHLEKYFLLPLSWNALRKNPLSIFGSAFSHQDTGHLLANYSAFSVFAPLAIQILGESNFSHLYLVSILMSSLMGSMWQYCALFMFGIENEARYALGASGAISGVIACVCLSQYYTGAYMPVGNQMDIPLNVWWIGYVLSDVAGLFRQETLMKVSKLVLEGRTDEAIGDVVERLFGNEESQQQEQDKSSSNVEEDKNDKGHIDKSVGYDLHLGGALGGAMFEYFFMRRNSFSVVRRLLRCIRWTKKELLGALWIWLICIVLVEIFM